MRTVFLVVFCRMDKHISNLRLVCRFGGRRLFSIGRGISYNVCNSRDPIRSILHIDVAHDKPEIHLPMLCSSCHRAIERAFKESKPLSGTGAGLWTSASVD